MRRQAGWLTALMMLGMAPGARAADDRLSAVYAFSWAGIDVGEFQVDLGLAETTYTVAWTARTTGLLATLFPFTANGEAEGQRSGGAYRPSLFAGRSVWSDGGSAWRVRFDPTGRAQVIENTGEGEAEREPVPDALRVQPDPASLALMAIGWAQQATATTATSFDGRRAVEFVLQCTAGGPSAADEIACQIDGRLLAGASRKWRERAADAEAREPVRVWLRREQSARAYWPVRLEAPSGYGTVAARLVRLVRPPGGGS